MKATLDSEARSVASAFVDGKIDHHWLFDWYQDKPREREYLGFEPFRIFMDVDDGYTTLEKERERLAKRFGLGRTVPHDRD